MEREREGQQRRHGQMGGGKMNVLDARQMDGNIRDKQVDRETKDAQTGI